VSKSLDDLYQDLLDSWEVKYGAYSHYTHDQLMEMAKAEYDPALDDLPSTEVDME